MWQFDLFLSSVSEIFYNFTAMTASQILNMNLKMKLYCKHIKKK